MGTSKDEMTKKQLAKKLKKLEEENQLFLDQRNEQVLSADYYSARLDDAIEENQKLKVINLAQANTILRYAELFAKGKPSYLQYFHVNGPNISNLKAEKL